MNKSVCSIIVTYNPDISVISKLIHALINQVGKIIIIDNNSNNKDKLNIFSESVRIIFLNENIGLAAAQNIAIRNVGDEITHIVLFDQDSTVKENFVTEMLRYEENLIYSGYKVSAVGPKLIDQESSYEYPSTLYKGIFSKRPVVSDNSIAQTFIIASGSLIRMDVIKEVGLMCERYFIDYIDVEWCMRAKSFGYFCYINSKVSMNHSMGDSRVSIFGKKISMHSDIRRYYTFRNALFLCKLDYIDSSYKRVILFHNLIRFFLGIFLSKTKFKTFKIYLKGFLDGLK